MKKIAILIVDDRPEKSLDFRISSGFPGFNHRSGRLG